MSMTGGELKVLLALDKLGSYIQTAIPYQSINGYFTQDQDTFEVNFTLFSGSELAKSLHFDLFNENEGEVRMRLNKDIGDIQFFLGPLAENCLASIKYQTTVNEIECVIFSTEIISTAQKAIGFKEPVSFEIRVYPTV